MKNPIKI